ncbi:unnamed protein product [Coccothraustes coccothraustes]
MFQVSSCLSWRMRRHIPMIKMDIRTTYEDDCVLQNEPRQSRSDQTTGLLHQKRNFTTEPLSRMTVSTGDWLPLKAVNL